MNIAVNCTAAAIFLGLISSSFAATNWTGNVDQDINNAGNWDNGLPSSANLGTVPTGSGTLTGNPSGKFITINGDTGFSGSNFGGNQANGFDVTFNGTGNANFTGNGLFLGWDDGAANNSSFTWNSTGTADTTRLFTNRFAAGSFTQTAGTINQNSAGGFNMVGGEFNNQGGTTWLMSGGTFNSAATQFEARFGNMTQSGGDLNANVLNFGSAGTWNWDFSGGTINVTDIINFNASDAINFTTGSTGVLNVTGANYSIGDATNDINAGRITINGAAATPAEFSLTTVGPNTEVRLIPEPSVGVLAALGLLGICARRRRRA